MTCQKKLTVCIVQKPILMLPKCNKSWAICLGFQEKRDSIIRLTIFAPKKLRFYIFLAIILPLNIVSLMNGLAKMNQKDQEMECIG
jgi:hypothetical protein